MILTYFMPFIYRISNNHTGRTYVGMTKQPAERRWVQHKLKAKNLSGNTTELHTAMNNEGIENFSFEVIEECSSSVVSEREIHWINELNSHRDGYNQCTPREKKDDVIKSYDKYRRKV